MNVKEYKKLVEIWKMFEEDNMYKSEYEVEEMFTNFMGHICRECGDSADVSYCWFEEGDKFFAFYCNKCADALGINYKKQNELLEELEKEIEENRLNSSKVRRSCFDDRACYCAPFEDEEDYEELREEVLRRDKGPIINW